jgi:hypothetical protein
VAETPEVLGATALKLVLLVDAPVCAPVVVVVAEFEVELVEAAAATLSAC